MIGAPYSNDTTSLDAAIEIAGLSGSLRAQVMRFIASSGGACDFEIETALELKHETASARRWELAKIGAVVDSGRTRETPSGRKAIVWVIGDVDALHTSKGAQDDRRKLLQLTRKLTPEQTREVVAFVRRMIEDEKRREAFTGRLFD